MKSEYRVDDYWCIVALRSVAASVIDERLGGDSAVVMVEKDLQDR
jgi:hypothetical protein